MQIYKCKQCGRTMGGNRSDASFCSDECKAAWHRDRTSNAQHETKQPGEVHARKWRDAIGYCEHCGSSFAYNDYADRGGQRRPKYCSNNCRQAAFRARKKAEAAAQQEQQQRQEQQRQEQQRQRQQGQRQRKRVEWDRPRASDVRLPHEVLGVPMNCNNWAEIKAAYRGLMKQYHPDVYKGEDATARAQEINRAFEWFKSHVAH